MSSRVKEIRIMLGLRGFCPYTHCSKSAEQVGPAKNPATMNKRRKRRLTWEGMRDERTSGGNEGKGMNEEEMKEGEKEEGLNVGIFHRRFVLQQVLMWLS